METQAESSPDRRKQAVIAAVVVVAIIAVIIFLLTRSDSNESAPVEETTTTAAAPTTTVSNMRTLPVVSFRLMSGGRGTSYVTTGASCAGAGSFEAVKGGAPVVIRNGSNEELARASLADGVPSAQGCTFAIAGTVTVPKGDTYVFDFPGLRSSPAYPVAEIERSAAEGLPLFGVKDG